MSHTVLLIGGHGKVSQLLTPLLLAKSWNVTSMIRSAEQKATIEKLGEGKPGKLSVLVSSVEEVRSEGDAKGILEIVRPDWVVWSAGAGGRGGPSRTLAIDHDAAIAFTKASVHTPSVKKFLTVSYLSSRRNKPSWWTDEDWAYGQKTNTEILPTYAKAKIAADEVLTIYSRERLAKEEKEGLAVGERFAGISLRPGVLTEKKSEGVRVGKLSSQGTTSREAVAQAIVAALETEGAKGYIDVLDGETEAGEAIKDLVRDGIDTVEGEDLDDMKSRVEKL